MNTAHFTRRSMMKNLALGAGAVVLLRPAHWPNIKLPPEERMKGTACHFFPR